MKSIRETETVSPTQSTRDIAIKLLCDRGLQKADLGGPNSSASAMIWIVHDPFLKRAESGGRTENG